MFRSTQRSILSISSTTYTWEGEGEGEGEEGKRQEGEGGEERRGEGEWFMCKQDGDTCTCNYSMFQKKVCAQGKLQ